MLSCLIINNIFNFEVSLDSWKLNRISIKFGSEIDVVFFFCLNFIQGEILVCNIMRSMLYQPLKNTDDTL